MKKIVVAPKDIFSMDLEAYAYFLEHEFDFEKLQGVSKKFFIPLNFAVKQRQFTGKAGTSLIVTGVHEDKAVYLILLGIGDLKSPTFNVESYRRAVGQLVRILESHKINSVGIDLPKPELMSLSYKRLAQETTSIIYKATFHFDEFITNEDRKIHWNFDTYLNAPIEKSEQVQDGINLGICIGKAINRARYLCDMPPSRLTPTIFANKTVEMAQEYGLKYKVFNEQEILDMGMGGLEGVSRGSSEECRLVILEYNIDNNAPTIAIVGKGITFDSGGLSIKPSAAMETMKDDMAGAAVVTSVMQVIAQTKPKINVIALTPLSENMPGCSAIKPGDVLKFYNGKTAEVLNTDAEGRLVLADALSYAVKNYKLDSIIDVATLTGACAYFLGPFYAGLLSRNDKLAEKLLKASKVSGDRIWRLPMDEDYRSGVVSEVADLLNTGKAEIKAGAITAAFFLDAFVDKVPHAHLDIAGVAFGPVKTSYFRTGATGFGVRLLVDLIMNWDKENFDV